MTLLAYTNYFCEPLTFNPQLSKAYGEWSLLKAAKSVLLYSIQTYRVNHKTHSCVSLCFKAVFLFISITNASGVLNGVWLQHKFRPMRFITKAENYLWQICLNIHWSLVIYHANLSGVSLLMYVSARKCLFIPPKCSFNVLNGSTYGCA